jgi:hypothetical protein
MNAIEVARNHFNSWNSHDADAIVGAFVEGGTYNNPNADQALTGAAIGDFAKSVPLTHVRPPAARSELIGFTWHWPAFLRIRMLFQLL